RKRGCRIAEGAVAPRLGRGGAREQLIPCRERRVGWIDAQRVLGVCGGAAELRVVLSHELEQALAECRLDAALHRCVAVAEEPRGGIESGELIAPGVHRGLVHHLRRFEELRRYVLPRFYALDE